MQSGGDAAVLAWVIGFNHACRRSGGNASPIFWSGLLGIGWMLFDGIVSILVAVIFLSNGIIVARLRSRLCLGCGFCSPVFTS